MSAKEANPFTECAGTVLSVLEKKSFYRDRFFMQVKALYPGTGNDQLPQLVPTLYLNTLFTKIPTDIKATVAQLACRKIVNSKVECPSPSEVRQIIAESALEAKGMTFATFYERAKNFLAHPPLSQETANRWLEKIIYTAVKRVTHERFALISTDDWKFTVTEVMLTESIQLASYEIIVAAEVPPNGIPKRNFRELLSHGR